MISYNLACGQSVQHSLNLLDMAADVNENIRRNLLRIMDELRLNQTQLGLRVGVDSKYINKILNKKRAMGKALLERIAKALNIGVQELIKEEPQKPHPPNSKLEKIESLIKEADKIGMGEMVREKAADYISLLVRAAKQDTSKEVQDDLDAVKDRLRKKTDILKQLKKKSAGKKTA